MSSQHENTNSKGDFVPKNRVSFETSLVYKNKSDSDLL